MSLVQLPLKTHIATTVPLCPILARPHDDSPPEAGQLAIHAVATGHSTTTGHPTADATMGQSTTADATMGQPPINPTANAANAGTDTTTANAANTGNDTTTANAANTGNDTTTAANAANTGTDTTTANAAAAAAADYTTITPESIIDELMTRTIKELRGRLKEHGLSSNGTKKTLAVRLAGAT
jgi:hypothetical protein